MYQLLSGTTIKLRLACIWVKCGFSSAATSVFYTFKIRRSAGPQIRILPPANLGLVMLCYINCFLPPFYNCITHRTPMTAGLSMIVYVLYSHLLLYWVASVNLY